jgi:predicted membrane chloride channel (bestrophin family)
MKLALYKRHPLLRNSALIVLVVIMIKLAAHGLGWEFISVNPLFSGLVAANVFLMGFLLSGVLADYKESEKLPGEIAAGIETITDEMATLWEHKQIPAGRDCLGHILNLTISIRDWFSKKARTHEVMGLIAGLNHDFIDLEPHLPANFIARLKQEQHNLRRTLIRIHTIRETSFVTSGYVISEAMTLLLTAGLILSKIDPFYESLFFVGLITFLFSYLGLLIRDLDNPFGYYESNSTEDVSLQPILDTLKRLEKIAASINLNSSSDPGVNDSRLAASG